MHLQSRNAAKLHEQNNHQQVNEAVQLRGDETSKVKQEITSKFINYAVVTVQRILNLKKKDRIVQKWPMINENGCLFLYIDLLKFYKKVFQCLYSSINEKTHEKT